MESKKKPEEDPFQGAREFDQQASSDEAGSLSDLDDLLGTSGKKAKKSA